MKATQVNPTIRNDRILACDVCGKPVKNPYGYTRHGNGVVCGRACQEKYDEMLAVRFGDRAVRQSDV